MSTKTINTRIQMKHDSAEKWSTSTFVPFEGEIIFYSDLNKIKIGDGSKTVNELPFITIDKTDIIEFINHNHDGQYYTEKEVDSLISALEILLATKYDNSSVLPANQIEGSFGIALIPNTTNVYSLGTSEKNWKNIYLSGDLIFDTDVKINSAGITLKNNTVLTDGTNSTTINDIVNHNHNSLYYQKSEVDSKITDAKHTITANASDDDVVILTGTNGQNAVSYTASHSKTNKAGTYTKVTVNEYGHVTSGANPTNLSGYGITDAYTQSEIDAKLLTKANLTEATSSEKGLMSAADKTNLDKLVTAWTADGNDDQLINKVEEVVKAFENAPEGTNIVTALANKADNVEATQEAAGLMSAEDKKFLETIVIPSYGDKWYNVNEGTGSHAEGNWTRSYGDYAHAEGDDVQANGYASHGEGSGTRAEADYSHTEGSSTTTDGIYAHAEGNHTTASGEGSHAEGYWTTASGIYSHAEGESTTASEEASHAEGEGTTASGPRSHAEGGFTTASGIGSHAEGLETTASGEESHAEGRLTVASGDFSHAGGWRTVAGYEYQTVVGEWNDNKENTLFEIGKGTGETARSNAFEVLKDGRAKVYGAPTENEDVVRKVDLANLSSSSTDETVTLARVLYTYVPIGNAQKASNKVIGSGSAISISNPGKLGDAGDSLKSVFNKLFGTETAAQPTVSKNISLEVDCDTTSSTSIKEFGTYVGNRTATYTISLSNSATVSYGYRCGSTNYTGSRTVYYPANKAYNSNDAQVKITLPSNNTGDTKITMVSGTLVNSTTTGNILYCNFDTNKQVKFSVTLPAAHYTTSSQTRYGQVSAEVTIGNAQTENTNNATVTTTNANKIDAFLAYKPVSNVYEDSTTSISGSGVTTNSKSAITITSGYVPYAYKLTATIPTSLPIARSKNKYTSITVSGGDSSTYLYIFVPSSEPDITSIKSGGFGVPFTKVETSKSFIVNNNKSATYKVFKTDSTVVANTFDIE